MLSFSLPGCKRKILFPAALNFSPDCPHPTAKFALPKIKFSRFRLGRKSSTCSYLEFGIAPEYSFQGNDSDCCGKNERKKAFERFRKFKSGEASSFGDGLKWQIKERDDRNRLFENS